MIGPPEATRAIGGGVALLRWVRWAIVDSFESYRQCRRTIRSGPLALF